MSRYTSLSPSARLMFAAVPDGAGRLLRDRASGGWVWLTGANMGTLDWSRSLGTEGAENLMPGDQDLMPGAD